VLGGATCRITSQNEKKSEKKVQHCDGFSNRNGGNLEMRQPERHMSISGEIWRGPRDPILGQAALWFACRSCSPKTLAKFGSLNLSLTLRHWRSKSMA
jgi:hypothetical protein